MLLLIEQYLFYFFLFTIPFQTRKILWYSGWRFNEWQSISIYATDIFLVVLLFFWALNLKKFKLAKSDYFLIIFLVVSGISVFNSSNYTLSFFQWMKLSEFVVLYFYLSRYAFAKFGLINSLFAVMVGGIFQAVVAIVQFVRQSSLGFRYLGESVINFDLSGIASFYTSAGEKVIRAYGTTPHPNVLATCLFFAMFSFYFIYLYYRLHSKHTPFFDTWDRATLGFYGVMLFAFFTTFSRVIVFIWFVSFCLRSVVVRAFKHYRITFGTKEGRKRIIAILLVNLAVIILFSSLYFNEIISRSSISGEDQAVTLRAFYTKEALGMEWNLLGVGTGNFVGWLMEKEPFLIQYAYQPVHNIYLLIYSETGILGLGAFLIFLVFLVKDFISGTRLRKSYDLSMLFFFCSILFIGFFDHLFWTLQQGRLVFWSSLGLLTYLSNNDII
ncbi:MAG: O-antigen ligase family protein [bacterium]|nr:O-antigen ligase family protein [bacterium]